MSFPEFSYTRQMESILTMVSIASNTMFFYLVLEILLKIYDTKVSLQRKVLFIVPICWFYLLIIYGTYAFFGFNSIPERLLSIVVIPNPLLTIFCYYVGIKVLKLSNYKSINVVRHSYFYMLITISTNIFIRRTFFAQSVPYNYLLDALTLLLCDVFYILSYIFVANYIDKHSIMIRINDSIKVKNWKLEFIISFLIMTLIYLNIIFIIVLNKFHGFEIIVVIIQLIFCLLTDLNLSFNRVLKNELAIKDSYIDSLSNSIESFNELKKEFNNMLNSYDNYLEHDNFDELKLYHESLVEKTLLTNEKIKLAKRMNQNPVLISVLLKKLEYANSNGILFFIPILCPLENMYIDDLDLSMVLGNLLDNAIETAAISLQRRVSFSVRQKDAECKLIIISNSTKDDVDIDKITVQKIATKEGHDGLGIIQARNTLRKYGNSSLHFNYYKNEFSVYIEVWSK